MDLVNLRLFVNVAESGSVTRGAALSHLSLPSASARVREIEERAGVKLLYREARGVTLTAAGITFLRHARLVLRQVDLLHGALQEYAAGNKGHLRLYATHTAVVEFLPRVLGQYLSAHPDVNIDLRQRPSVEIIRALIDGETDMGVVASDPTHAELEFMPYRPNRLVLVVPVGHALENCSSVPFERTLDFEQVCLAETSGIGHLLQRKAQEKNHQIRARIQVTTSEEACQMVHAKVGLSILPELPARRLAASLQIRLLELDDEWSTRMLHICIRKGVALPSFVISLINELKADLRPSEGADCNIVGHVRREVICSPADEPPLANRSECF